MKPYKVIANENNIKGCLWQPLKGIEEEVQRRLVEEARKEKEEKIRMEQIEEEEKEKKQKEKEEQENRAQLLKTLIKEVLREIINK